MKFIGQVEKSGQPDIITFIYPTQDDHEEIHVYKTALTKMYLAVVGECFELFEVEAYQYTNYAADGVWWYSPETFSSHKEGASIFKTKKEAAVAVSMGIISKLYHIQAILRSMMEIISDTKEE